MSILLLVPTRAPFLVHHMLLWLHLLEVNSVAAVDSRVTFLKMAVPANTHSNQLKCKHKISKGKKYTREIQHSGNELIGEIKRSPVKLFLLSPSKCCSSHVAKQASLGRVFQSCGATTENVHSILLPSLVSARSTSWTRPSSTVFRSRDS